jgi:hypothetical protein
MGVVLRDTLGDLSVEVFMPTKTGITPRLQIELTADKLQLLEDLRADTGIATKKDLVNNALTLLMWAVRETQKGRKIVSWDEETNQHKEILLPALENRAPSTLRR